jgi:hypothetical protein
MVYGPPGAMLKKQYWPHWSVVVVTVLPWLSVRVIVQLGSPGSLPSHLPFWFRSSHFMPQSQQPCGQVRFRVVEHVKSSTIHWMVSVPVVLLKKLRQNVPIVVVPEGIEEPAV